MGRFTQWLNANLPRTGRMIKEDGNFLNEADGQDFIRSIDIAAASVDGTLFRGFWEGTVPGNTTYNFVIDIPPGVLLRGFTRTSQVRDETLETRFLSCTGFTPTGDPRIGKSLNRTAEERADSQCVIRRVSAMTGVIEHSPAIALAVAQAAATRMPSVQSEIGALPCFDETEYPAFRYVNATGGVARLALYLFWQELDAPIP